MRSIAFVSQKGGAGKTTLASNIAVAAHQAGERVFICDLDPLQSLVRWSKARNAPAIPTQHVPPDKLAPALVELKRGGVTLAILDTPGSDSRHSAEAIRIADLCIIPARPNTLDLWASEATLARVKAEKGDFAFLLNQCPPAQQSARVARGAAALQEMGALLTPLITTRVDYLEAVRRGLGVCEFNSNGVAAREIGDLWNSLRRRLDDREANGILGHGRSAGGAPSGRFCYPDLFLEAMKVGNIYSSFMSSLLQMNDARVIKRPPAPADPSPTDEIS
jgi:chromosome partitioning protein